MKNEGLKVYQLLLIIFIFLSILFIPIKKELTEREIKEEKKPFITLSNGVESFFVEYGTFPGQGFSKGMSVLCKQINNSSDLKKCLVSEGVFPEDIEINENFIFETLPYRNYSICLEEKCYYSKSGFNAKFYE